MISLTIQQNKCVLVDTRNLRQGYLLSCFEKKVHIILVSCMVVNINLVVIKATKAFS